MKLIHGVRRAKTRTGCRYDTCNRIALIQPQCFLMKPQSSVTAEGCLSLSQRLSVCLSLQQPQKDVCVASELTLHVRVVSHCLSVALDGQSRVLKVTVLIQQLVYLLFKITNMLSFHPLQTAPRESTTDCRFCCHFHLKQTHIS